MPGKNRNDMFPVSFVTGFSSIQKQPGPFQDQSGSFRGATRRHFEGSEMPFGQFSIFLKFVILGPFSTIFRLSQNHWTFPNAATRAAFGKSKKDMNVFDFDRLSSPLSPPTVFVSRRPFATQSKCFLFWGACWLPVSGPSLDPDHPYRPPSH